MRRASLTLGVLLLLGGLTCPAYGEIRYLHHFDYPDGIIPHSTLVTDGQRLYGATFRGGPGNSGTVFALNFDGSGYEILHAFNIDDGYGARGELALVGSRIFGTTTVGGRGGVIYGVDTDGSDFEVLRYFNQVPEGVAPVGGVLPVGDRLYGTTEDGGANGTGVLYSIAQDGSDFRVLHEFFGGPSDGRGAQSRPVLVGSRLIGTTDRGGDDNLGTVYSIGLDGADFHLLHEFTDSDGLYFPDRLALVNGRLYGTASAGLDFGGAIFNLAEDGTDFTILRRLANSDGSNPVGTLITDGTHLYGAALHGGAAAGTVFSYGLIDGTLQVLYRFLETPDGDSPDGGLLLVGDTLYGTTTGGGLFDAGTVYAITVPEPSGAVIAILFSGFLVARRVVRANARNFKNGGLEYVAAHESSSCGEA